MRPNLELARLIGSHIAHRAFGDEVLDAWIENLNGLQSWQIRGFLDHGVVVFDCERIAKIQSTEVISRAGVSMTQAAEAFRQLGESVSSSAIAFTGFAEAVASAVAPLRDQYERYRRDVIYLRLLGLSLFGWHFMPESLCGWISENYPFGLTPAVIRDRIDNIFAPIREGGLICRFVGHEYWMSQTQPESRSVMPGFRYTCKRCGDVWKPKQ